MKTSENLRITINDTLIDSVCRLEFLDRIYRDQGRALFSFILDALAIVLSYMTAYIIYYAIYSDQTFDSYTWLTDFGLETATIAIVQLSAMFFTGGYDFSHRTFLALRLARRIVGLILGTIIGTAALVLVFLFDDIHRLLILIEVLLLIPGLALASIAARRLMMATGRRSTAVIITETEKGRQLAEEIATHAQPEYNQVVMASAIEYEMAPDKLKSFLASTDYCVFERAGTKNDVCWLSRVAEAQTSRDIATDLDEFYSRFTGQIHLDSTETHGVDAALGNVNLRSSAFQMTQRVRDLLISLIALILTAPFWPIIAVLIKLDSKGPVLFRQERLGQFKRPFSCLKFRTMVEDAERESGPKWATADDPRITRIGAILRATRLDELPQLINVLRGDMGIVGPRPIREHFARRYKELIHSYDLRFLVRPGLTGWAQLRHKYAASDRDQIDKFRYDIFYLSEASHDFDLAIMIGTVKTLIRRSGV